MKHSDPVQSHQFIAFRQCNRESSVPLTNHSESNLELNASFGHSQTSSQITSHQINNRRTPRPLPRCPNLPEDPSNKHAIGESKNQKLMTKVESMCQEKDAFAVNGQVQIIEDPYNKDGAKVNAATTRKFARHYSCYGKGCDMNGKRRGIRRGLSGKSSRPSVVG